MADAARPATANVARLAVCKPIAASFAIALAGCAALGLHADLPTAARAWDTADETFTRWTTAEADAIVALRADLKIAEADRRHERLASAVATWDRLSRTVDAAVTAGDAGDAWTAVREALGLLRAWGVLGR